MSHAQLYRAMMRQSKRLDAQPWRRSLLLSQPALAPFTAGLAAQHGAGHAILFLAAQQPTSASSAATTTPALSVQQLLKQQFRHQAWRKVDKQQSLSRGFEILRRLKTATESASTTAASSPSSSSIYSPSSHSTELPAVAAFRSASSGVRRAGSPPPSPSSSSISISRPQPRPAWLQANRGADYSSSSSDVSFAPSETSGGVALHRVSQPSSSSSTLGRLHRDAVELQKPRTPSQATATAVPPLDPNHDSAYADAVFQMGVVASEYLKLVSSAPSAAAPTATAAGAASSSTNAATSTDGVDLFLIEQSRMRHQHARWEAEVTTRGGALALSTPQQVQLEALVMRLGTAVQSSRMEEVLAFQADLAANTPAPLARALFSNNQVLDAWVDFLYAGKKFTALASLVQQRLVAGVHTGDYSLSRKTMCKLLTACAIEGNVSASMMVLSESSWGALSRPNQEEVRPVQHAPYDLNPAFNTLPSSVNKMPSWVPMFYSTEAALTSSAAPRQTNQTGAELEDGPDLLMTAAGDGFGAREEAVVAPVVAAAPVLAAPTPMHPRLSINLHARPLSMSFRLPSPMAGLFSHAANNSSSSLHHQNGATAHLASMSTRARSQPTNEEPSSPVAASVPAPVKAAAAETIINPPTPLPIIDLWSELNLDSRLMELALVAAVRSESRQAEFARRDTTRDIAAHAAKNPHSENLELNLAMHEHAMALMQQSKQQQQQQRAATATARLARLPSPSLQGHKEMEPDSDEDELEFDFSQRELQGGSIHQPTLFQVINDPTSLSPMAFQLYSIMLQQQIPLQHPHTFVQLMANLSVHAENATVPSRTTKLLLSTLSAEMSHSRSAGAPLQHKWLRGDVGRFRSGELDLHQHLSSSDSGAEVEDGGDSAFQAIEVLRQMHSEGLAAPSMDSVVGLCATILSQGEAAALSDSEHEFARSKLLQDLITAVEDYSAIEPDFNVRNMLAKLAEMEDAAAAAAAAASGATEQL